MQLKTARRFLSRNKWKLAQCVIDGNGKAKLKRAEIARKIIVKAKKDSILKIF